MAKTKKNQPGFEQLLQELEQTVNELEQGSLTLEQTMDTYGAGLKLLAACNNILQQAEEQLPQDAGEDEAWS